MLILATMFLAVTMGWQKQEPNAAAGQQAPAPATTAATIPEGTRVALALAKPVRNKTTMAGDNIYAAVAFPVSVNGHMVLPVGTYVQGTIDSMKQPTWHSNHAEFQMHFTTLIFANGYAVPLAAAPTVGAQQNLPRVATAFANVYVDVSSRSDILLDNGSQIEMVFQTPLTLDAQKIADAARLAKSPLLSLANSATQCRPVPGTPGTTDTVIPGTPGTPGTPDTVIPGGPGMPPTIIPGIPPTPSTPPTVIPGTAGTAGVACPGPPIVVSRPSNDVRSGNFELPTAARVAGRQLAPGKVRRDLDWRWADGAGVDPAEREACGQRTCEGADARRAGGAKSCNDVGRRERYGFAGVAAVREPGDGSVFRLIGVSAEAVALLREWRRVRNELVGCR